MLRRLRAYRLAPVFVLLHVACMELTSEPAYYPARPRIASFLVATTPAVDSEGPDSSFEVMVSATAAATPISSPRSR